jgi:hypothetical protein
MNLREASLSCKTGCSFGANIAKMALLPRTSGLDAISTRDKSSRMAMHHSVRSWVCALGAAGLVIMAPVAAGATEHDAVPACGGDKGKDVKKPKPDDEKRPVNPASVEALCGGDKGKDVKKPKPDDDQDKRPQNPA